MGYGVEELRLIDHHCHGVVPTPLDAAGFEALIGEGGPAPDGATAFDTPAGLAIRRHCAPVLGLEPHASAVEYLQRRTELGADEVNRRMLAATNTEIYCVDTGFHARGLTGPWELARIGRARGYEILRLEAVAEALAAEGVTGSEFSALLPEFVAGTAQDRRAVAVKTVAAYRTGFALEPSPPSPGEVAHAAIRWINAGPGPRGWRLADPVLIRRLWWIAVDLGLPIQFHVGLGDADVRMHDSDPTLLVDWLSRHRVPVMLLHCWPYHRQAGFMAAVHPHVHLDVGLALHQASPARARAILEEAAEVAPFGKLLYSSDAFGLAEHYHLAALSFRRALDGLLRNRVEDGEWSAADAARIAVLLGRENAARVYRLGPA